MGDGEWNGGFGMEMGDAFYRGSSPVWDDWDVAGDFFFSRKTIAGETGALVRGHL
jgi:hypothetical protein